MDNRRQQGGFSLVELMVVILILIILIMGTSVLLSAAASMTERTVAKSNLFQVMETVSAQLTADAEMMVGPAEGGFLLIGNETVDVKMAPASTSDTTVRADQLAFVRLRGNIQPVAPGAAGALAPQDVDGDHVRIWYGPVDQYKSDSATATNSLADILGSRWALGRQAVILAGAGSTYARTASDLSRGNLKSGEFDVVKKSLSDVQTALDSSPATALTYMFTVSERLTARRLPFTGTQAPTLANLDTQRVAQMHPLFVRGVCDYQVQFAGDYDPRDGVVDVNEDGSIRWYDTDDPPNDGNPVANQNLVPQVAPFYSGGTYTDYGKALAIKNNIQYGFGAGKGFVFLPGDIGPGCAWPYLVRVRYWVYGPPPPNSDEANLVKQACEHIIAVKRPHQASEPCLIQEWN